MNPTGPIGPRSIGVFAFAVGLVVKQVLHGPARRVIHKFGLLAPPKSRGRLGSKNKRKFLASGDIV
jgi:hypothetical protein